MDPSPNASTLNPSLKKYTQRLVCLQVEVYEDPYYGTPVFKIVSGLSKCPHEANTLARENVSVIVPQVCVCMHAV